MTDTIIQFKYSDDVHMISIYIKSDTHQQVFIPLLFDIVKSCKYTNINRSWGYVVAEIISKIVIKYESKVEIKLKEAIDNAHAIYKYICTVSNDLYNPVDRLNRLNQPNKLIDYFKIKDFNDFDGLLKDFNSQILAENNQYLIKDVEQKIKDLQKELKVLKKQNK